MATPRSGGVRRRCSRCWWVGQRGNKGGAGLAELYSVGQRLQLVADGTSSAHLQLVVRGISAAAHGPPPITAPTSPPLLCPAPRRERLAVRRRIQRRGFWNREAAVFVGLGRLWAAGERSWRCLGMRKRAAATPQRCNAAAWQWWRRTAASLHPTAMHHPRSGSQLYRTTLHAANCHAHNPLPRPPARAPATAATCSSRRRCRRCRAAWWPRWLAATPTRWWQPTAGSCSPLGGTRTASWGWAASRTPFRRSR